MGFLDIFRKKKEVSLKELKWNKMWDLWVNEEIDSPYRELMTYYSEVNNGGHAQYFSNVDSVSDLKKEITNLKKILPFSFKKFLDSSYKAYLVLEEKDDENSEEIMEESDNFFYENEEELIKILEEYALKIEI